MTSICLQGQQMLVLPLIVMGALLIVGGFASLFLPETRGRNLPQTLEEGEAVPLSFLLCCCVESQTPSRSQIHNRALARSRSRMMAEEAATVYHRVGIGAPATCKIVCSICKKEMRTL